MHGNHAPADVIAKKRKAISLLRNHRGVAVALSGGVDSAVLLALAREALGASGVIAMTGRSAAVTDDEVEDAKRIAAELGVAHEIVDTREIDDPAYRANLGDRCFHCRSELFTLISSIAKSRGIDAVAYGAIVDDLGDDRPGMRAASQLGIVAPLLDADICKSDIRVLAKLANLHVQDKPASPCLASRIAVGIEVTEERLEQVRSAEAGLRRLGFRVFRVRHHGPIARIELGDGEIERLSVPGLHADVVAAVKRAGFRLVTLDLEGYRSGGGVFSIVPIRESGQ